MSEEVKSEELLVRFEVMRDIFDVFDKYDVGSIDRLAILSDISSTIITTANLVEVYDDEKLSDNRIYRGGEYFEYAGGTRASSDSERLVSMPDGATFSLEDVSLHSISFNLETGEEISPHVVDRYTAVTYGVRASEAEQLVTDDDVETHHIRYLEDNVALCAIKGVRKGKYVKSDTVGISCMECFQRYTFAFTQAGSNQAEGE